MPSRQLNQHKTKEKILSTAVWQDASHSKSRVVKNNRPLAERRPSAWFSNETILIIFVDIFSYKLFLKSVRRGMCLLSIKKWICSTQACYIHLLTCTRSFERSDRYFLMIQILSYVSGSIRVGVYQYIILSSINCTYFIFWLSLYSTWLP